LNAEASPLRRFLLAAAMALVLGGLGGLLAAQTRSPEPASAARFIPPREEAFDFKLRDQDGRLTSLADARGDVVVLTFLYTSCWDLCPAQAADVADAVERAGDGVVIYAVTVDPVGDTREHVRHWLDEHGFAGKPIKYLTGAREQLRRVWRAYGIVPIGATPEESEAAWRAYEEQEEEEEHEEEAEAERPYEHPVRPPPDTAKEEYPDADDLSFRGQARHAAGQDFEHSAYVLLIDPQGEQRVGFPFEQLDPALIAEDIRLLRR
jgi:protein SCO1/2